MLVLKGRCPIEGGIEQYFTEAEQELAVAMGRAWYREGLRPRLLVKSWDGKFSWLTSLLSQKKLAA